MPEEPDSSPPIDLPTTEALTTAVAEAFYQIPCNTLSQCSYNLATIARCTSAPFRLISQTEPSSIYKVSIIPERDSRKLGVCMPDRLQFGLRLHDQILILRVLVIKVQALWIEQCS